MKKLKGFSLAELLITLGIISIIATMGIQISKKGFERAYNYYFYTSYKGVQTILLDCKRKNKELNTNTWMDYIRNNLATHENVPISSMQIDTSNGNNTPFGYGITMPLGFNNVYIGFKSTVEYISSEKCYRFIVSIPAPNGKRNLFELLYFPDLEGGVLIPSPKENAEKNIVSLLNRPDLLPTYVDDGEVARVRNTYDPATGNYIIDSSSYKKPKIQSYKDTYCNVIGKNLTGIITCPAGSPDEEGTIRIANPKKIF